MKTCWCGQSLKTATWAIASALTAASLAGCGAGANFVQGVETDTKVTTLGGIVHGGPNAVIGATVTLYATTTVSSPSSSNNYGYGQPGTVLDSTTTDSSGNYAFTSPATCPAGQQAYIVASGGTSSGQLAANSASLLMAAIGPCSSLSSSTYIFINEASTIAAAYAIGQFMTVGTTSGPDGIPVNVSAPANNNAATPGCTVTAGRTTACQAAGLAHAFLNAANLVSPVGTATSLPSGFPNLETPNGSGLVPVLLINTLANSVEACVNSSGSGSAPCTSLMADTQPAAALISPQPAAPTNSLQALTDLAQYPQPSEATAIFNVGFSNGYYQPSLTSAPPDFSLAIIYNDFYPETDAQTWAVTSDIADNIYMVATSYGVAGTEAASITSNGSHNWSFVAGDGTIPSTGGSFCYSLFVQCGLATDTLGHLYVGAAGHIYQINTTDGLLTDGSLNLSFYATPHGNSAAVVAVDQDNDAFATIWSGSGGGSTIQELLSGGTAWSDVQVNGANFTADVLYVTIDNGGNLWLSTPSSDCCSVYYIANSSVYPAAPSYTSSTATQIALNPGDTVGSTTMIDAQGNAWLADQDGLYEGAHAGFPAVMEVVPSGWFSGVVSQTAMDGDGKIAVAAATANLGAGDHFVGLWYPVGTGAISDASSAEVALTPCGGALNYTMNAPAGGCAASLTGEGIVIDDTGSIWVAIPTAPYDLVQVLGPGAPTWGQASFGKIGNGSGNIGSERPY